MPQTGDFIQLIVEQTMAGIDGPAINNWSFEVLSMTGSQPFSNIAVFLDVWYSDIFSTPIRLMQSSSVVHTLLRWNNYSNYVTDFLVQPLSDPPPGQQISDFSSSASAWSFELVRQTRLTRNGSKRIPGVPDILSVNNAPTATAITLSNDVVTMLEVLPPIDIGAGGEIQLALVIPKTPVAPATLPTQFNTVTEVLFRGVGSQNSRKQLL